MSSIAFLFANAKYDNHEDLPCCLADLEAMHALVTSTGRYAEVIVHSDIEAEKIRNIIRDSLRSMEDAKEIFFYFSGHGAQIANEFYYCGTQFDSQRPNVTGLSHSDLHDLFRSAEPELLVKIVDSCASGTLLIKEDRQPLPLKKEGFKNVVQLASCLDQQNSFGGDPLSKFTESFCQACLQKTEGPIYYGDIINILRDDYLNDEQQTPFFVSQGTGRESLTEDASKLEGFRKQFEEKWSGDFSTNDIDGQSSDLTELEDVQSLSVKELLDDAESKLAGADEAKVFIDTLFDGVIERFNASEFVDLFEIETKEYSDYQDSLPRDFMIKVLMKESRPDNFVTAESKRVRKKPHPWESALAGAMMAMNTEWTEHYNLDLNCVLNRAQLAIILTPKYKILQRLKLVLSCAPSLEICYVFELATRHSRTDWNDFSISGSEIVRRWYKMDWDTSLEYLIEKVCAALEDSVTSHVEAVTERLNERRNET